jgi:hypothetical protein
VENLEKNEDAHIVDVRPTHLVQCLGKSVVFLRRGSVYRLEMKASNPCLPLSEALNSGPRAGEISDRKEVGDPNIALGKI